MQLEQWEVMGRVSDTNELMVKHSQRADHLPWILSVFFFSPINWVSDLLGIRQTFIQNILTFSFTKI